MSRRNQNTLRKVFPYITVVVIGVLVVLGVVLFAHKNQKEPVDRPVNTESTPEATEDPVTTAPENTENGETTSSETENAGFPTVAAVDALQVDMLIDRYYTAKLNNDAAELNKIVDTETPYTVADLADESQFIAKYDNFRTYITPGPTDYTYVAYVRYDIFFNGINTGAPALNRFVIHKDTDGYYVIFDRPLSGEFQSYLLETENSANVQALVEEVNRELDDACKENEDLNAFIDILKGRRIPETTAEEETTAPSAEPEEEK